MKDHDVLIQARSLIASPDKWIKGDMKDDQGRFCLVGAINEIDALGVGGVEAKRTLAKVCGRPPVDFNEDKRTTHEDVMRVLDLAIEKTF
jgi:hypothetical protein